MKILAQLRRGKRVQVGYSHNTYLLNLKQYFECESQGFGERPEVYGPGGHNGIDIVCDLNTEIHPGFPGFAYYKEEKDANGVLIGYGRYFTVINTTLGLKVVYAHLNSRVALDGWVNTGDVLGLQGTTGFSSGVHSHQTLKLIDNNGNVLNRDNGHDGAIDPTTLIAFTMFDLVKVDGSKEVWLIRDGKKTHVYNAGALLTISDFASIKTVNQADLDAIPDSGIELAALIRE